MPLLPTDDDEYSMETRKASPANLLIKIESFSSLSKNGFQKYESTEFGAEGYKWSLTIYPDGQNSENKGDHISVYLTMVGPSSLPVEWEVNAIVNIFLFNQILGNYLCFRGKTRCFHATKPTWGFSKLISKKSLTDPCNGFLVDDTCVFGAEVFVIKSQQVVERLSLLKMSDPYKREWKISRFSKSRLWTSEVFTVGDHKWYIMIYPNGDKFEKGQSVSMYLHVDSKKLASHEKVKADYCLRIKNQLDGLHYSKNMSHWFTSSESSWGWKAFIPISDMHNPDRGFIVKKCCHIEIEITVQAVARDGH